MEVIRMFLKLQMKVVEQTFLSIYFYYGNIEKLWDLPETPKLKKYIII